MTGVRAAGGVSAAVAVALLAAGTVVWAALPMSGARAGAKPVLVAATCFAVLSLARLVADMAADRAHAEFRPDGSYVPYPVRTWRRALATVRSLPWAQCLIVAVLGLEALHPARAWHTAVLCVVLLGYLFALHVAETGSRPTAFGFQLPLVAAGIGLAGLAAGAAVLPAASAGSGWLSVAAAIAALIAAGLAVPL